MAGAAKSAKPIIPVLRQQTLRFIYHLITLLSWQLKLNTSIEYHRSFFILLLDFIRHSERFIDSRSSRAQPTEAVKITAASS